MSVVDASGQYEQITQIRVSRRESFNTYAWENIMVTNKRKMNLVATVAAIVVTIVATTGAANAAEFYRYGVLVSNVCTGNYSGAVWVYPLAAAQPVGSACRIPTTGELGTVGG